MNNYEFNVNLYEKMKITVVAENEEEARRILKDTLDSITVKDIKDKLSKNIYQAEPSSTTKSEPNASTVIFVKTFNISGLVEVLNPSSVNSINFVSAIVIFLYNNIILFEYNIYI